MKNYVSGLIFDIDYKNILLIEKLRPEWQRGKLNVLGGKVEPNETPILAVQREIREECGLDISNWDHFVTCVGLDWQVHFFKTVVQDLSAARTIEDEKVIISSTISLPAKILGNLRWLIPLGMYAGTHHGFIKTPLVIPYLTFAPSSTIAE